MPLTIYKASAGSGKTFILAVEYISLLVKNPEAYRNILAVTFTNKATAEMKMRILSQLYGIAHALPESDDYLKEVHATTKMPKERIRERAATALSLLAHHYNEFRVLTIDAFFQTVLRNLARELDLTANMRLALNDKEIEEEAVDEMIHELRPNAQVLKWIGEYIQTKMDQNLSWNVISSIKDFGQNIFAEFYQNHRAELNRRLSTTGFFDNFHKQLIELRDRAEQAIHQPYQQLLDIIQKEGLDDTQWFAGRDIATDLAYIRRMAAPATSRYAFQKALTAATTKTRLDHIANPDKWVASKHRKTAEGQRLAALAREQLCHLLEQAEQNRTEQAVNYLSANMTLAHLNQLRLLRAIEQAVDQGNQQANRFLLSNTQHLLHTMIDGSDTPFIFEKIGAQLKHIMIDEFQDTSTVQWRNFKVLLDNCLAQPDSRSLIVGDVKQSIYRWRAGDWRLLNDMHEDDLTTIIPKVINYRSSHRIVAFNNAFFQIAAQQECAQLHEDGISSAEQITQAYADVEQQANKTKLSGRVEVCLISKGELYHTEQMNRISQYICRLLDQGIAASRIAILTRKNDTILNIAQHFAHDKELLRRGARLVSDEAFRLESSLAVRIIIKALHFIAHPDDRLAEAELAKHYQRYVLQQPLTDADVLLHHRATQYLPEAYASRLAQLATMPLADLTDHLYQLFQLSRLQGQTAYLCAFRDLLNEYLTDHNADIDDILQYWDTTMKDKKIQADNVDGIRILTIYKSKGLEFDHVILPYCDWTLEKNNTLWCDKPRPCPFDALPVIPIDFSPNMLHTVFAEDYREEHFQNTVDNLNILYVAFTRAKRTLLVIGMKNAPKTSRSLLIQNVMQQLAKEGVEELTCEQDDLSETYVYDPDGALDEGRTPLPAADCALTASSAGEGRTHGSAPTEHPAPNNSSFLFSNSSLENRNVFQQEPEQLTITVETFLQNASFRQSNRSRDFVSGDEPTPRQHYISRGNLLHQIFANIRTQADVAPMLQQLTADGIISSDEQELQDLRQQVEQCLRQPEAAQWFSPHWTLHNECSIITTDPSTGHAIEHRPDRVMSDGQRTIVVDFKFGHPRPEYHQQVRQYVSLLQEMGMSQVEGYLWYVTLQTVEVVSTT